MNGRFIFCNFPPPPLWGLLQGKAAGEGQEIKHNLSQQTAAQISDCAFRRV